MRRSGIKIIERPSVRPSPSFPFVLTSILAMAANFSAVDFFARSPPLFPFLLHLLHLPLIHIFYTNLQRGWRAAELALLIPVLLITIVSGSVGVCSMYVHMVGGATLLSFCVAFVRPSVLCSISFVLFLFHLHPRLFALTPPITGST